MSSKSSDIKCKKSYDGLVKEINKLEKDLSKKILNINYNDKNTKKDIHNTKKKIQNLKNKEWELLPCSKKCPCILDDGYPSDLTEGTIKSIHSEFSLNNYYTDKFNILSYYYLENNPYQVGPKIIKGPTCCKLSLKVETSKRIENVIVGQKTIDDLDCYEAPCGSCSEYKLISPKQVSYSSGFAISGYFIILVILLILAYYFFFVKKVKMI